MLAYAYSGASIKLRDLRTKQVLGAFRGHKEYINGLVFSPDSKTLATASLDGTAKLWRVPTGQLLLTIPSQWGVTWCTAFSPDGRILAIGSGSARRSQLMLLRAVTEAEAAAPKTLGRAPASLWQPSELTDRGWLHNSPTFLA